MFIMSFPWALLVAGLIFVAVFAVGIVVGLLIARSSYKPFLNMMIYDRCAEMSQPVVLCKDCKNDHHCMIQDFMNDCGVEPDTQNNFFCGYGEREKS